MTDCQAVELGLNQLNEAIRWGARSSFVDIPTDCPQRDERQGWTGDLAVFASTASYNFDTGLFSVRPNRRLIWRFPFQFGDWTAPGLDVKQWIGRGKWIATAYFANSCGIVARIADLLGETADAERYRSLQRRTTTAYREVLTDGAGTVKKEFQTAYVLPLHFGMTEGAEAEAAAANLLRLIDGAGGHLATGFPGTPYILFALSDSGHVDEAYKLLMKTDAPSWLYMIVAGGTTIWERWGALRPDGTVNTDELSGKPSEESNGGMVSFNHYAAGAVGDWLYRRVAGIEPIEGGYRSFRIAPVLGGGLTSATGRIRTPYGPLSSDWEIEGDQFTLRVEVPVSTVCEVRLPDGRAHTVGSGTYSFSSILAGQTSTV